MNSNNTNKKLAILILVLILIFPTIAYAKPFTEAFKGGLTEINNFFDQENYKPYSKTIDFVFFSLLFISIYMIGVRYAFKEVKRPETLIAVLLGLMSAFLLVLGGFSATILLPYIPWLLYALLFILYWWLLKGIKNKFWRFMLALLLTLLTIALVQGLFNSLTAPQVGTSFFKDFGASFKGIEFPGISQPGMPSYLQDLFEKPSSTTTTTTEPGTGTTTTPKTEPAKPGTAEEKGFFGKNNWIIPLLILLALGGTGFWNRKRIADWWRNRKKPIQTAEPSPAQAPQAEPTIQDILNEIDRVIKEKNRLMGEINKIRDEKNQIIRAADKRQFVINKLASVDIANLFTDEARKEIEEEGGAFKELLEVEKRLISELKNLQTLEKELWNSLAKWSQIFLREGNQSILQNIIELKNLIENKTEIKDIKNMGILWLIQICYDFERREEFLRKELEQLEADIEGLVKGKFERVKEDERKLSIYIGYETGIIKWLEQKIGLQIRKLEDLRNIIGREGPTELNILKIQNPAEGTTFSIGSPIAGLQAVIKNAAGNTIDPTTLGGVVFLWYIRQGTNKKIIRYGNNVKSLPIPSIFVPTPPYVAENPQARLGVVLVDKHDKHAQQKATPHEIDIKLTQPEGRTPYGPPPYGQPPYGPPPYGVSYGPSYYGPGAGARVGNISQTLMANSNAVLNHYDEIEAYLRGLPNSYLRDVLRLAGQIKQPMPNTLRLAICIPVAGHQEDNYIYESLKNYTYQTADSKLYEINLFVNHPDRDLHGNTLNAGKTLSEIDKFIGDYPNLPIKVVYSVISREQAKIGYIRKLLTDAVLLRHHNRGRNIPDIIIVSNDADNKGIAYQYIDNFIKKFNANPKLDGLVGQLEWDPESYIKYPLIYVGTRLFQYFGIINRRERYFISSGANFAFKSSIYAAIGGYNSEVEIGEDTNLGESIISARRSRVIIAYAGSRVSRIYTSSRRAIYALQRGIPPAGQWNLGFSAFDDEVRKLHLDQEIELNYDDPATIERMRQGFEWVINSTFKIWFGGVPTYSEAYNNCKKALSWIGIEFIVENGLIKITNMDKLIRKLKEYRSNSLYIRDLKTGKIKKKPKAPPEKFPPLTVDYILTLTPVNSTPTNEIKIIGVYHEAEGDNTFEIGKGRDNDIVLEDWMISDEVRAGIEFRKDVNRFLILQEVSIIEINNSKSGRTAEWLNDGDNLKIGSYEFNVSIRSAEKNQVLPKNIYENQFPIVLKLAGGIKRSIEEYDLEKIGFEILREIDKQGRAHPLAFIENLDRWLSVKYPGVKAEVPLYLTPNRIWLIIVLTSDEKNGIGVPALDSIIGPGKIMKWFEGGRYNGTQDLALENVKSFAKAHFDEKSKEWVPTSLGIIQL